MFNANHVESAITFTHRSAKARSRRSQSNRKLPISSPLVAHYTPVRGKNPPPPSKPGFGFLTGGGGGSYPGVEDPGIPGVAGRRR